MLLKMNLGECLTWFYITLNYFKAQYFIFDFRNLEEQLREIKSLREEKQIISSISKTRARITQIGLVTFHFFEDWIIFYVNDFVSALKEKRLTSGNAGARLKVCYPTNLFLIFTDGHNLFFIGN